MQTNGWTVDDDKCYRNCDFASKVEKRMIIISPDMWKVIRAMLIKYPTDEWQMLLSGTTSKHGCYCSGYYIPKQEVGSATVRHKDNITADMIKERKFVAGIHSHVNMAVFASGVDVDDSIMSPIPYHVIVNNRHELGGYRKAKLPCGGFTNAQCDVSVEGEIDLNKIEIQGLENISKVVTTYYQGGVPIVGHSTIKDDDDIPYLYPPEQHYNDEDLKTHSDIQRNWEMY